jgi:dimethylargininase
VALVRGVADGFPRCVTEHPPDPPLDVVTARSQHDAYVLALQSGGFTVVRIPADEDHPDCCFVEDTAVIVAGDALLTRPGHPSRRREVAAVGDRLGSLIHVEAMASPATLDGGDVLHVGSTVYVGVGGRTNRAGYDTLAVFAEARGRRVRAVRPRGVLHLKSAATALDDSTVLLHRDSVDGAAFDGLRVVESPDGDPAAANVLRLPDGGVVVSAAHPRTAEAIDALGYRVVPVDVDEFHRADGALTCLSVRIR